jgi:N-acetylmuramoyl-L-alanine amidase
MQGQRWVNVIGLALTVGIHAGCQSPSSSTEPAVANAPSIMEVVTLPAPTTPAFPTDPVASSARPPASKRIGPPPWPTNGKSQAWIPFETWTDYNGFGKPRRLSSSAQPSYESRASEGVFGLRIGSQQLNWNGLECWLAYAPQIMKGMPYIHALDAEKNLQPLAQPTTTLAKSNRVIVIDPGHGGVDAGARNAWNNSFEKTFTLDWAMRLKPLLAAKGWAVFLTRTTDADVAKAARVAFADRFNADFFLSLHFNSAYPNVVQAGVETYCLTPTGLPSNLVRNYEDNADLVFANNAFDTQNLQYACRLHRELLKVDGAADRGVRRARFMTVLQGQKRPAVLLEGGYLSNLKEAQRIATPAYRQELAEAVARAFD